MPAWWGRKSSKQKQQLQQQQNNDSKPKNPKSFDDDSSPLSRKSKEFSVGSSGFDSDSVPKRGHPLPRPSSGNDCGGGSGIAVGSGSVSVSSVSSSGSSDDHAGGADHGAVRGNVEINFNTRPISPGPSSRGAASPTSPLHPRLSPVSVDSPTGRLEDGKSQGHKLPLPPGSPTSPSAMTSSRMGGVVEHTYNHSKWKKGRLLGRGTFGHVYLGFNSESGQMCAIKEVKVVCDDQTSKECLRQLNQEINLLSQLSHPNIVQYYGSDLGDESLSVYLEYVSGGSIHKLLQEYGAFKEPVIQNYTRQILSGLSYLHARNTVHRDIKGANILVDPNGEIKLADFGMAKHITSASSMLSFKGSPYWMAPEVVMNTNGYNLAVDIWSLGCTILEMATSKPPWSQYEGVAAIFKIGNSKDMPELPNHLSNDAKEFVRLCLQRDPSLRPTPLQLLDHPFIRNQTRAANVTVTRDAFPYAFDGSRTPPVLELHSRRTSTSAIDVDFLRKPVMTGPRTNRNLRENARTITSLPVSPCSSPLRQHGPLHKSCFLSPPHPTYTAGTQNGFNFPSYPVSQNTSYTLDPSWQEPFFKVPTRRGSPKSRVI